jgi:hypothetical protein
MQRTHHLIGDCIHPWTLSQNRLSFLFGCNIFKNLLVIVRHTHVGWGLAAESQAKPFNDCSTLVLVYISPASCDCDKVETISLLSSIMPEDTYASCNENQLFVSSLDSSLKCQCHYSYRATRA